ncbi:MAG TPA: YiiX/YebB-like N1pC/P60 family cysteine hydrolase [Puia sp.]|uniref:YiiX/YebB-like N1pC/P60 family cysteine hydrolase n=1 Tax=Puia sp. TaxID=2045100 RepID=UPI002C77D4A0|nr:YiiX/YebB-like N1pC/P60 family cysteine hydrolase [Puia sp.]HVU97781.1 YiiX/YebB-like N1pC/P60 family cysteine hydrolase [Puia sp.]
MAPKHWEQPPAVVGFGLVFVFSNEHVSTILNINLLYRASHIKYKTNPLKMKYLIEASRLQVGDIVLVTWDDPKSEKIRRLANSEFSHAMVYVGGHSFIHSSLNGVEASNCQRILLDGPGSAAVYRCERATQDQIDRIVEFARSRIGMEYSLSEAKQSVRANPGPTKEGNREFCTRFAARALEAAAIAIVNNPDYCTPKDLEETPLLKRIEGCIREASPEESKFGDEESPILNRQQTVINSILAQARQVTEIDIQTISQMEQHLEDHPEYDAEFDRIVKESGYLDLWKYDLEKNPYYYSIVEFEKTVPDNLKAEVARFLARLASEMETRFSTELLAFSSARAAGGLKYFATIYKLNRRLVSLQRQRSETAYTAMQRYGS